MFDPFCLYRSCSPSTCHAAGKRNQEHSSLLSELSCLQPLTQTTWICTQLYHLGAMRYNCALCCIFYFHRIDLCRLLISMLREIKGNTFVFDAIHDVVELSNEHFRVHPFIQSQRIGLCHLSPHWKQNFSPHEHVTCLTSSSAYVQNRDQTLLK